MEKQQDITGIILSGGKSSRMGTDKAFLKIGNSTFIERIAAALNPFVKDIMIVSDHKTHDAFGIKRIKDLYKDAGPLSGILSGLNHSKTENNIVLSCDIPFISGTLIRQLITNHKDDALINQIACNGKTMPLVAMYKKQCALQIKKQLAHNERRVRVLVSELKPHTISINSKYNLMIENINTPKHYKRLKHEFES
ncbi:MAG: molybdenum cofactor guanylyltransferase [Flavobacteriaceae bacterium]|nr:molybdenum cofactor guanylyltransferase [Flavobacteriaceae bacterium]